MKISDALVSVQRLGIETSPFIYYVENHPSYVDKVDAIFQYVELLSAEVVASAITLTETLVKPIQAHDRILENDYRELLTNNEHVRLIVVTATIAERAARLRARYNLRTPDALHVATALESGCDAFLTNDMGIKRVTELRILVLDELELDPPAEAN